MCIRDRLQIAHALGLRGEDGARHAAQALAQVLKRGAHGQAVLGEGGLRAAVDDLLEQLAHGRIDRVADQVGVERFEDGLARQDLRCHGGRMRHAISPLVQPLESPKQCSPFTFVLKCSSIFIRLL